jgi:non-ribosomal peptide synthase protein (TIGR01720 family)
MQGDETLEQPDEFADDFAQADEVAVVGLAGRFPGARNVEEFWRNLRDGVEAISFFSEAELERAGLDADSVKSPNHVRAGGVLEDVESFDASFFGFNPREAEITDPQHRLFLECAWEALEDAGYDSAQYKGLIGVYAGVSMNTYLMNLYTNPQLVKSIGNFQIAIGNDKDFLPTRVSYKLNLKGPSLTVQTACSTSLVAIHIACQSLLDGQCDMALAGGVSVSVPQKTGYFHEEGGIFSRDGHCRAFDAEASGFVSGNGVGIVVLKRLEDALRDRDCIHAVIKGSAINNDGSLKMGYTAPSEAGQAEVIATAQAIAGIKPEAISYVEAHGTGTALGDPIEVAALTKVFRRSTSKNSYCALGSVKTNVGHLDAAAGVTGFIKTVLALKHKQLPPSLNFNAPNPEIDFASTPFFVNDKLTEWRTVGQPRRAGVSSFGIGGTNAHVILEEAPSVESFPSVWPAQALTLSARTSSALEQSAARLADYLEQRRDVNLRDVAYTLQVGRRAFAHRVAVVCRDVEEAIEKLRRLQGGEFASPASHEGRDRPVVFMFSGQGAQYVNMGRGLYGLEPVFTKHLTNCCELLSPFLGLDLRDVLYPTAERQADARDKLRQTSLTQPALFAVEYALAQMWMNWGVQPEAFIGHSIGEFVAACLAGVFTLEEALRLVAARGRLMQEMTPGSMLAVSLGEADAREILAGKNLSLAAVNGASSCVFAGADEAIEELLGELSGRGIAGRRLETSHAFHSASMERAAASFAEEVAKVKLGAPQIPYISNVTGTWIREDEARDPRYWGRQLCETVRFGDGLSELSKKRERILLEVGPGRTLATLAKHQHNGRGEASIISTLKHPGDQEPDAVHLRAALGLLWTSGGRVDWLRTHADEQPRRVSLPTYPFERVRCWIDAGQAEPALKQSAGRASESKRVADDIADWFYVPVWHETICPTRKNEVEPKNWLIFMDECGVGNQLASALKEKRLSVVTVEKGDSFARLGGDAYRINPARRADYERLLGELHDRNEAPEVIFHLWSLTRPENSLSSLERLEAAQTVGFYSLLFLAQSLGEESLRSGLAAPGHALGRYQIRVVSNNMQGVTGGDLLCPEKATVIGACRVIPQEYPHITCRSIDLETSLDEGRRGRQLIEHLIAETDGETDDDTGGHMSGTMIAYRHNRRWVQKFERVRLEGGTERAACLRERGVYLVTGGLGGVGLEVADYLARRVGARLVLVGRTALPAREDWDEWLSTHDEEDESSKRIKKVLALEAAGASVLVVAADITRPEQARAMLAQVYEAFGALHGVIHAAGVAGEGLLQLKTPEAAAEVLEAKVHGTVVLDDVLKDAGLDFFALFASLRSVQGGVGHVDYCAANAFQDAFARGKSYTDETLTVAIDWGGWQATGMSARFAERRGENAREEVLGGMSAAQGVEAFSRVLASQLPQVIVTPQDLCTLLEESRAPAELTLTKEAEPSPSGRTAHQRPHLRTPYVAPGNEVESTLANLWQELLGIEQVGVHDNFFELGGDSVLSLRILAKANQEGLRFSTKQIFEHQTIAELAAVVGTTETVRAEQGLVTGRVPLTPIQHWFFEQEFDTPQHWNQAVLVEVRQAIDPVLMRQAVQHIVEHHDALRLRFVKTDSGWEQRNTANTDFSFEMNDLSLLPGKEQAAAIQGAARKAQTGFNLSEGPLMKVVAFNLGARRRGRLLFVIHHLAVDAVSWRILLEDFASVYTALARRESVTLPPKSTSFKQWATLLAGYASSEACAQDSVYWTAESKSATARLPLDFAAGRNTVESGRTITSALGAEQTRALLQDVPAIYKTQINDVLLTALAQTLTRWTGESVLTLELEGHAREPLFDHVDLTRTVGWLTSVFPVTLKLNENYDAGEALRIVKEQLRRVPQHGMSYGLLRYLGHDQKLSERLRAVPQPEVGFLYFGQLDQEFSVDSLFALSDESAGAAQSPANRRPHVLDVEARVSSGQLQVTWIYSENLHRRETIEALAAGFVATLGSLVEHALAAGSALYTPSDFPEADLSQKELDHFLASISELED